MKTTDNEVESTSIFGFTNEDIALLQEEWETYHNKRAVLTKIATRIFRQYDLRYYDELLERDINDQEKKNDIMTAILNIQSMILLRDKKKTKTVRHQKGDFKHNADGSIVVKSNGDPDTYDRATVEETIEIEKVPLYPLDVQDTQDKLEKMVRTIMVLPDFEKLRKVYESNTDLKRALDLITELTRYWKFDDPAKFVARFALFASNVKAKALGYHPKWPVLFSMVGGMGIGKSWLAEKIALAADQLFGTKSASTTYESLTCKFNSQMMTRGILRLDEAVGLDKSMVEMMKIYITEPTVVIEPKGLDRRTVPNEVSFLSTTNESVLASLCGNDKSRRVVEFQVSKIDDIDEKHLMEILTEMWKAIPVKLPNEDAFKNELLIETSTLLDSTMEDVVYDIFKNHKDEVVRGQRLMKHEFKTFCTQKKIQVAKVTAWCQSKGILDIKPDGHVNVLKKGLDTFLDQMDNDYAIAPNKVDNDFDELLEGC